MQSKTEHLLRYTGVNIASTVVDYSVFLSLTHFFGMPVLQASVAYALAIVFNYSLTKRYVFVRDMSHKSEHRLFIEFFATGCIGLFLTAAIIWITVHTMALPPVEGKTVAMLICFVTLYFVRSRVVFNGAPVDPSAPI